MTPITPGADVRLALVGWAGLVHGFAGCGCLAGVLPAFGLSSWPLFVRYVTAFLVGSVSGAILFSVLLGLLVSRAEAELRASLVFTCNWLAILAGLFLISYNLAN